jgi:ABC-type Fe3+-hydroxamate transport system substrate-binding protein
MIRFAISTAVVAVALCAVISRAAIAEEVKCEGTISKIEGATVTIKAADAQHEVTLAPASKITLDGKPAKSTDLKVGQKVKCSANKEGGKATCTSLEASSASN